LSGVLAVAAPRDRHSSQGEDHSYASHISFPVVGPYRLLRRWPHRSTDRPTPLGRAPEVSEVRPKNARRYRGSPLARRQGKM
jgi:hypothetical protein